MVKICPNTYPTEENTAVVAAMAAHFAVFPFELSPFQQWSIQAIIEGNHALICAHTGSGKTLPAEFAISYFSAGSGGTTTAATRRKVIYCSPIKALSNQKYHDFQEHPLFTSQGITFGLITGDIKSNPSADVLIMTTEILLNKLYGIKDTAKGTLAFDLDFADVACVIFDEVHYINDRVRGHVWEQSIMLLPVHVQLVMLSATLESPEMFARWVEDRHCRRDDNKKEVYLTITTERIVPLVHYSYITCSAALFKQYGKDKEIEGRIRAVIDTPQPIKLANGTFCEQTVDKIKATLQMFDDKRYTPTRQYVMNQVCKYLGENQMFPAICFVYSRKQVEDMARELETVVLEDDSKVRYIVHKECEAILRRTLPNWAEYTTLPEYQFILSLLEKGVAIHHAGLLSIFREMIEIIFARGYIKILFATETFSVGINMPTKTVLFTSLSKFDGMAVRPLLPHEYNQQSGRAGRRGKDTIGHVIHLTNLWDTRAYTNQELRHILMGAPQRLESKFHVSYPLVLYYLSSTSATPTSTLTLCELIEFANKSMLQQQMSNNNDAEIAKKLDIATKNYNEVIATPIQTPPALLEEYLTSLSPQLNGGDGIQFALSAKQQKANAKRVATIKATAAKCGYLLDIDVAKYTQIKHAKAAMAAANAYYKSVTEYSAMQIHATYTLLKRFEFVDDQQGLTLKGNVARFVREMHCIAFTEWFMTPTMDGHVHRMQGWDATQIVQFLCMFTAITVADMGDVAMEKVYAPAIQYGRILDTISAAELEMQIQPGADKEYHVALVDVMPAWCECETEPECKAVLYTLAAKGILLGEFVKAVLKVVNLATELEAVAEYLGDLSLLDALRKIPRLVLKFICTNQSLYI